MSLRARTLVLLGLVVVGLVMLSGPAGADPAVYWRGGVFVGFGPWWGPSPYWWYPPPYYYPPTVIIQQPPVYIERPAPPPPPPAPPASWYYCASAKAYYPSVPTCPEEWVKVPARP